MAQVTYAVAAGTTAVAALTAGSSGVFVASYVDGEERGRTFIPEGSYGGSVVANTVLPQLFAVFQGTDVNNPTSGGGVTMELRWPTSTTVDVTDQSSPQNLFLDEEATVVYVASPASGTL